MVKLLLVQHKSKFDQRQSKCRRREYRCAYGVEVKVRALTAGMRMELLIHMVAYVQTRPVGIGVIDDMKGVGPSQFPRSEQMKK